MSVHDTLKRVAQALERYDSGHPLLADANLALANIQTTTLQHRPWYVVPDYQPPGKAGPSMTAKIVNARGELVAHFEDIEEARDVIALLNGEQA